MANNRLAVSGIALVVLAGLAAWKMSVRYAEEGDVATDAVKLPKVDKAKVTSLEITNPGTPTVLLTKQGETWQLTQPLSATTDTTAIESALAKLDELEVAGVAATRKENHARLEVDEATGVRVVAKAGDKTLCDLLIGKYASGNTMVREHTSDKVASVRGSIRYAFAKEVKDWRERSIVSFDMSSTKQVAFVGAGGTFTFVHEGDAWKQAPGEKAITNFDGAKVQAAVSVLSSLRANDFAEPGITAEQAGVTPGVGAVTITTGGDAGTQQVVLRIGNAVGDNHYVQADGNPVIFLVSSTIASRMLRDSASFATEPAAAAPTPPPSAPTGMPSNMQIQGLPPGVQLPPEVLQQIQQQAAAQALGH